MCCSCFSIFCLTKKEEEAIKAEFFTRDEGENIYETNIQIFWYLYSYRTIPDLALFLLCSHIHTHAAAYQLENTSSRMITEVNLNLSSGSTCFLTEYWYTHAVCYNKLQKMTFIEVLMPITTLVCSLSNVRLV